jgi:hypothetical protein
LLESQTVSLNQIPPTSTSLLLQVNNWLMEYFLS